MIYYKIYLQKKLTNVISPYIITSIPAIIAFTFFTTPSPSAHVSKVFYAYSDAVKIIYFYLNGNHFPQLWFIPMISLYYLISPLLIRLDKKKWIYFLLPAFFTVSLVIGRKNSSTIQNFAHFFSMYLLYP